MKKIFAAIMLLVFFVSNAWAIFNGPTIPQNIPFTSGGKTYVAYVQTWHPHYAQSQICYYSSDFDQTYAPVIAKSGVTYGFVSVVVMLNPASFGQAWDSTSYNDTDVLCALYYSGGWYSSLGIPTQIAYTQYGWNDWYFNGSYGYDHDLSHNVRAIGIDVKINETYDFNGQFYLGSYASGDVVVAGSALFASPVANFTTRTVTMSFGATWSYGECPVGTDKKHAGLDVTATTSPTDAVYAAHTGVIRKIFTGQHSTWADAIVVEDTSSQFTTVYWHISTYGGLAENDTVTRGQQIATVADLGGNTHFHFGIRTNAYTDPESYAGALPVADGCNYLAHPEKFIDPTIISYQ